MITILCSLLWTGQTTGLTAPPVGLGVTQTPPRLSVMRGETATLSCHFTVQSHKYGVQWFRMDPGRQLILPSPRHILQERNQSSSLLITEATPEDSGKYYCEVNVLHREPEWSNGTLLTVLVVIYDILNHNIARIFDNAPSPVRLIQMFVWSKAEMNLVHLTRARLAESYVAPPSPPRLYLQTPADPESDSFSLVCVTWGFYPSDLSLYWTNQSAASPIDPLSINNCTLSTSTTTATADQIHSPQCVRLVDTATSEVYLMGVLLLPDRQHLETAVTYACVVEGHPTMTDPLTATYVWEALPNQLIGALNVLKMCLLSALTAIFALEAVKHKCS